MLCKQYHFIAIDFPGHGKSYHKSPDSAYLLTDYCLDVIQILSSLKLKHKPILMGHSMGAGILSLLTSVMPDLAVACIYIDFIGALTKSGDTAFESLKEHLTKRTLKPAKANKITPLEHLLTAKRRINHIQRETAETLITRNLHPIQDINAVSWQSDHKARIPSPFYYTEDQVHQILAHNHTASLLLVSDQTYAAYGHYFEARTEVMKEVKLEIIPGNHYIHFENAETTAHHILKYLKIKHL